MFVFKVTVFWIINRHSHGSATKFFLFFFFLFLNICRALSALRFLYRTRNGKLTSCGPLYYSPAYEVGQVTPPDSCQTLRGPEDETDGNKKTKNCRGFALALSHVRQTNTHTTRTHTGGVYTYGIIIKKKQ